MNSTLFTRCVLSACAWLIPFAVGAKVTSDDAQNVRATSASTPYKSVFLDYKSYQDPDVQAWKKSNADVSEIDAMKASSMGGMKGMSDKSMDNMKENSPMLADKKAASPPDQMPPAMPVHDGMQSR
ncbi:hypothetical protein QN360_07725 [Glaciimonas sp. CA11.2]|uniref:hypothetical protein n=1 Tax=unclassified Glaciimonas TaxID=2644401 RepID=UPI002AB37263|nr:MULTISPECIES: hypothetical protein [unclassified Glaciimonas]MDY7544918.1 hypothetical protein [Glaciimonas sp. CA11.2]MEB0013219.1 hypothetical protein [Glaciimonas sp. Cout2]MEB0082540.1 hypothetical protein [Glaciimonas sp. Gout2]MEB0162793.1 hypothetical protein [Glaciimonas sp. CA11.2]